MPAVLTPRDVDDRWADIVAALTRRSFLAGTASTLALVAGCGGASTHGRSSGGDTVTLHDAFGSVTVHGRPKRVVSVGRTDHDALLALGVVPAALYRFVPAMKNGVGDWAESDLRGRKPRILTADVDLELIASLRPDLIVDVQSVSDAKRHRTLSGIAPTLGRPAATAPNIVPWQRGTQFIAAALGRDDDGKKLVSRTETYVRARADQHPAFAKATVAVLLAYGDKIGVYGPNDSRTQLLRELGLGVAPFVSSLDRTKYFTPVSPERLTDIDADLVVILDQTGRSPAEVRRQFPTLANVPALKAGREVFVTDFQVALALANASVLSIPYAVRALEPMLAAALR